MELKVLSDAEDVLRLEVAGRIVEGDTAAEPDAIEGVLDDRGYGRVVVLSLAETEYIDSSGLAMLLGWHRRFCEAGGRLVLHSIPTPVMETLRIMRMELVLKMARDEPAAVELARGETQ